MLIKSTTAGVSLKTLRPLVLTPRRLRDYLVGSTLGSEKERM